MTIAELLALLGRAWIRLLIFPGGLTMFAVLWLARRALPYERAGRLGRHSPAAGDAQPLPAHRELATVESLSAPVFAWLAVALLPLPYTRPLERPVDVVFILALLEWPRLLAVWRDLQDGETSHLRAARRLAAALNGYPPAVLALVLLGQGVGSLELGLIAAGPLEGAPPAAWAMFFTGALGLLLVLPALVEAGPFAVGSRPPQDVLLALGLRVRALGYVLLAALPWLALLPPSREDGAPVLWLAPLPPLLIAALLWGFDRVFAGRAALVWARAYLWLSFGLLLALAGGAAIALRDRQA